MFDFTQFFLIAIILILTIFLIILGIQVFFILKDLRLTLFKLNRFLEDATDIAQDVKEPASALRSFFQGVKSGVSILDIFRQKRKGEGNPPSHKATVDRENGGK